jgi:hypothetical protein
MRCYVLDMLVPWAFHLRTLAAVHHRPRIAFCTAQAHVGGGTETNASSGGVVFSTRGWGLVFKQSYLQLTTSLQPGSVVMGLGEATLSTGMVLPRDGKVGGGPAVGSVASLLSVMQLMWHVAERPICLEATHASQAVSISGTHQD